MKNLIFVLSISLSICMASLAIAGEKFEYVSNPNCQVYEMCQAFTNGEDMMFISHIPHISQGYHCFILKGYRTANQEEIDDFWLTAEKNRMVGE